MQWTFAFACLQEASSEAPPQTEEPSSDQRPGPGSSCNSLTENHERNSLQHIEHGFSRALGCSGSRDLMPKAAIAQRLRDVLDIFGLSSWM